MGLRPRVGDSRTEARRRLKQGRQNDYRDGGFWAQDEGYLKVVREPGVGGISNCTAAVRMQTAKRGEGD